MTKRLYEWVFQIDDGFVSDDVDIVLCDIDSDVVRYKLTVNELLSLLEQPSETRDSIDSLLSSYRKASLDADAVLSQGQYVELDIGD
jgi:hypothetical protein